MKKGVPRNFIKFTGKHLCQSLIFSKIAGLRPLNTSGRLLLTSRSGRLQMFFKIGVFEALLKKLEG